MKHIIKNMDLSFLKSKVIFCHENWLTAGQKIVVKVNNSNILYKIINFVISVIEIFLVM